MTPSPRPTIAITTGEPAGIGPELCAALAQANTDARIVLIGDTSLLQARAAMMGVAGQFVPYQQYGAASDAIEVLHVPLAAPSTAGELNTANAGYVLATLDAAIRRCKTGEFAAMVTAPLHKGVIREAGYANFTGHTEYLAEQTGTAQVVMMLAGHCAAVAPSYTLRVALATTHLPLRDVPDAIQPASLTTTLRILHHDLQTKFGIAAPRILVAGLNPHAGEGGHLGREELDVIIPVLTQLRSEGMQLIGPLPADTLFNPSVLATGDAVLAMYHDQGLPVLKHATFGHGVNLTLGLPLIRTSVDHGTALDLAGTGRADGGSLRAAIELAVSLATTRATR